MLTMIAAMALAAAAPAPADAHAQPMQMGQMSGMDMSQMDHSKMGHMAMSPNGDACCKHAADRKMDCNMPGMKSGTDSTHQGHSGQ